MTTVEVVQRICGYEVHEAANAFPMMGEDETKSLVEDIKENGQIHACIRFEGTILDGEEKVAVLREIEHLRTKLDGLERDIRRS